MPGLNGTGPAGAGILTGRGLGPCGGATADTAGIYGRGMGFHRGTGMRWGMGFGYGWGPGCGRGFGLGFRAWAAPASGTDAESLKEALTNQKDLLRARMDAIDKRLETL